MGLPRFGLYPKVKVKVGDDDHSYCYGDDQPSPLMGLKAIDFLSIIDFNSQSHPCPGQEHQVFPERRARFDNWWVTRAVSASEGQLDVRSDEASKQNTRASPVPRPRAVLSSPSNDAMIGKKNKKLMEKNPAWRITSTSPHPPGNAAHQKAAAAQPSSYRSPKNAKIFRETATEKITPTKRSQGVCYIGRKLENVPPC